jgi:hypothetical protein
MRRLIFGIALAFVGYMPAIGTVHAEDGLITGLIYADGSSLFKTKAFTVAHPSAGRYVITFAPHKFGDHAPICVVTPIGFGLVSVILLGFKYCDITIDNLSGVPTDTLFVFMAASATGVPPSEP